MRIFDNWVAELTYNMNQEYKDDIVWEHVEKELYLHAIKAIYECMESALLWYNLFVNYILGLGFLINPYKRCLVYKEVNGSTCSKAWFIENVKVLRHDTKVVYKIIMQM